MKELFKNEHKIVKQAVRDSNKARKELVESNKKIKEPYIEIQVFRRDATFIDYIRSIWVPIITLGVIRYKIIK